MKTESLIDRFGRQINYLRISVTDRCNLRCVYCVPETGMHWLPREDILRFEEIREVVRVGQDLGISRVRLTGGEPLIREGVVELVEMLATLPHIKEVSLTTNGILLSRYAKELVRAGIKRVNISLDTLKEEKFSQVTRQGVIDSVLAGIEAALDAGMHPVKLNVVVMRGVNDDELVDLARLAWERPIHVRFIELMPFGDFFSREKLMPATEVLSRLGALGDLLPASEIIGCGPAQYYTWDGAQGTIGIIGAVSQAFCATCNRLRMSATGYLRPCLDEARSVDLIPALRPSVDYENLAGLIKGAVAAKPESHTMIERCAGTPRFCMAGVGG